MRGMGMTYLSAKLTRPDDRGPAIRLRFVVDSGALYSVLPERAWKRLGLRPTRRAEFTLADGTVIERRVSRCTFEIAGVAETSPAVLGEAKDVAILGVMTLETLGLHAEPAHARGPTDETHARHLLESGGLAGGAVQLKPRVVLDRIDAYERAHDVGFRRR